MSLTLGLTGMDPATETALKAAFTDANARIGSPWQLVPEAEAGHVMVDMDSMYGPMSWLRLHAAGKRVIGLTTAQRTQTDFRLGRPFDSHSFSVLLRDVASEAGVAVAEAGGTPIAAPPAAEAPPVAEPAAAAPMAAPEEPVAPAVAEPEPVVPAPEPEPIVATAAPTPPPAPPPAAARDPRLGDWLVPGVLDRRVRYRSSDGTALLIDPAARSYHGPASLKALAAGLAGTVQRTDFEDIDDAAWTGESAKAGAAQPLQRLQWLDALVAGNGELLPGYDPDGQYRLNKWPQTEREYPRHFRIATAMMKGPATLAEIAAASGMPEADVADFVNASLATGFADLVADTPPEPAEPAKSTGLFGRLRGK
ncbi:hypothetical protein ACFONC_13170 [Luteimonas soli]|uniref:Uncharacterized protein n=1 Tax=Luteimonas soli TaxID=1648966 RepID=A0ABV7XLQ2_9GAMM